MVIWPTRFNTYLACLAAMALLAGCQTDSRNPKKRVALLRVHLEVSPDRTERSNPVPITAAKIMVNIAKEPFLEEVDVAEARVVESLGGFALMIRFDRRGALLLEQYTAMNPGRRLAIYCRFGEKPGTDRWLSAPVATRRISNGILMFTPDATREEAEEIALGLNNVAAKTQPDPNK